MQQLTSDTLWFINPEGGKDAWQNALAAEPPVYNDDSTQMTVKLRQGIYWSDGVEFTSADVAYTVQTQIDHPGMNWSAAFSINVAGIEVPDRNTVVFRLKAPNSRFHTAVHGALERGLDHAQARVRKGRRSAQIRQ